MIAQALAGETARAIFGFFKQLFFYESTLGLHYCMEELSVAQALVGETAKTMFGFLKYFFLYVNPKLGGLLNIY